MRNYEKYYYDLLMSDQPPAPLSIYQSFYNKNGSFSEAKFNGYIKAGIEITNLPFTDPELKLQYTQEQLKDITTQQENSKQVLTLSKAEKEQIVIESIEEANQSEESQISITCPNCNATSFKYNPTDNTYKCNNCNTTYTGEELKERKVISLGS